MLSKPCKSNSDLELSETPLLEVSESAQADWRHLAESIGANYSLSYGWTEVTAKSHDIADRTQVLMAYQNSKLVAVVPTICSRSRFLGLSHRVLELVSNKVSYHNRLVTSLNSEDVVDMLITDARRQKSDVVHLAGIQDGSDLSNYLSSNQLQSLFTVYSIPGEASPYLPLDKNWDELLAAKPKKFRYKVRKRAESLSTSGKLQMRWFEDQKDCPALLDAMRIVEDNSWKKKAGISIFERHHERRYHECLLPFLSSRKAMLGNVLFHGEAPIAYNLCCSKNGWVGQLKTSFDTRFAELSPGSLVVDHAISRAIELDAKEFDFLGDTDPHKLAWTKSVRRHTDYFLYLRASLKGRVIGQLKEFRNRFAPRK